MSIDEREKVQAKGNHNIFNIIIIENSPNLQKVLPIRYRKSPGHQTDLTKIEPLHSILLLK
jgi:hypothetical protein